jgi:hypothetical protein
MGDTPGKRMTIGELRRRVMAGEIAPMNEWRLPPMLRQTLETAPPNSFLGRLRAQAVAPRLTTPAKARKPKMTRAAIKEHQMQLPPGTKSAERVRIAEGDGAPRTVARQIVKAINKDLKGQAGRPRRNLQQK